SLKPVQLAMPRIDVRHGRTVRSLPCDTERRQDGLEEPMDDGSTGSRSTADRPPGPAGRKAARRKAARRLVVILCLFYLLPVLGAAGLWMAEAQPANWRSADWSSAGLLPGPAYDSPAEIRVYAARTGRWKGIL